jgi:hypothetical protein
MQLLDMDVPVDVGEALVLTTAERARDLPGTPVYVDAMSLGGTTVGEFYENCSGWQATAQSAAAAGLRARTDLGVDDIDLFFPYDGYTVTAVQAVEAAGFCGPGEAGDLFDSSWDPASNILRTGGFAGVAEAVRQLRGGCGDRQVEGASTAMLLGGSFFHDPAAVTLTREPR